MKVKRHITWDITIGDNIIQRMGDSIDALASEWGTQSGLETIQDDLYLFTVSSSFILNETLEEQFLVYSLGILSLRGHVGSQPQTSRGDRWGSSSSTTFSSSLQVASHLLRHTYY